MEETQISVGLTNPPVVAKSNKVWLEHKHMVLAGVVCDRGDTVIMTWTDRTFESEQSSIHISLNIGGRNWSNRIRKIDMENISRNIKQK